MALQLPNTPAERRRFQQRAEARRAILDATEALLVEQGYDLFSMRRLADRCGYTAPSIYHHFGDKQGLLDALLDERLLRLLGRLRRVRRRDDPLETLRALARAFVRFGLENPTHYRLLTAPRPESSPPSPVGDEIRALFTEPLEELSRAGRLRIADLEENKQCLWALLHGVISVRTGLPGYQWSRTLLQSSLDAMLLGLVRPHPRDGRSRRRGGASA